MKSKDCSYGSFLFLLAVLLLLTILPAVAQDEPTIAKDTLRITAYSNPHDRNNWNIWSWVPYVEFRVNGPIGSGAQLYVEFATHGNKAWIKFDCPTNPTEKGYWWDQVRWLRPAHGDGNHLQRAGRLLHPPAQ